MTKRFYALNGIDDVNLKQAYLNSLPEPLGNETSRVLSLKNMALNQASLGEIYQMSLAALEKLCNHQKFFKQLQEQGKLLRKACDRPSSIDTVLWRRSTQTGDHTRWLHGGTRNREIRRHQAPNPLFYPVLTIFGLDRRK
ncbi:unnamed protein product [Arabis nemorensis]|uniref:Uncharacterized protein n=1 Tax=Arabis nemorensis TaxID=586526 RepID=A0A565BC78_9BRAS|nr:unnamed protein product [Arabis nemorensis]